MDDNDLSDFEPIITEMDSDHSNRGTEQKQLVETSSESSEGSDGDEDSVQITGDSKRSNKPAQKVPSRKNPTKPPPSEIIRRSTMPTLVMIPKIKAQVEEWRELLERGEECSSRKGPCVRL